MPLWWKAKLDYTIVVEGVLDFAIGVMVDK